MEPTGPKFWYSCVKSQWILSVQILLPLWHVSLRSLQEQNFIQNMIDACLRVITWVYNDASPPHPHWASTIMVNEHQDDSLSYINLIFLMIIVEIDLKFTSFPCFQLSLHLKSIQTQKHCSFVTKRPWCNIILQAPWMERVALTAFICKSLWGSVLLAYKSCFTLWFVVGKHQICTNGKKKKHYWQRPRLIYALIKSKQRIHFSLWHILWHNMWKITHTGANM